MAEVFVVGEVLGADGFPSARLFCRWALAAGHAWRCVEGAERGQTQVDDPAVRRERQRERETERSGRM